MKKRNRTRGVKKVEKSNFLFMRVWCSDPDYMEYEYAVIKITKEMIAKVNELRSIFKIISKSDGLYKITYWNPFGGYDFFLPQDDVNEKVDEFIEYGSDSIIHINKNMMVYNSYTESHTMDIYDNGIQFKCNIKNSGTTLTTQRIPFELFKLAERNVKN